MANTTGKKYGGRKKGTPNKLTKELREVLKDVLFNELVNIETHLDSLEGKERSFSSSGSSIFFNSIVLARINNGVKMRIREKLPIQNPIPNNQNWIKAWQFYI